MASGTTDEHPSIRIEMARIDERVKALEKEDLSEVIADVRVKLSEVSTQLRVTWALLFLVVSALVSLALSVWKGGIP